MANAERNDCDDGYGFHSGVFGVSIFLFGGPNFKLGRQFITGFGGLNNDKTLVYCACLFEFRK